MRIKHITLLGMLPLLIAACGNHDLSESGDDAFSGKEMQIVPSIGNRQARSGMENVSDIKAFMLQVSGTEQSRYDYYAAIKPEGDAWKSYNVNPNGTVGNALQMLWANAKSPVTVAALYKADEVLAADKFGGAQFEVAADQSTADAFKKGDYLYMPSTQIYPTTDNGAVKVAFSHLMAKICLKLTMDYQFNEIPGTETNPVTDLTIGGTSQKATFDVSHNAWSSYSSSVEVKPCEIAFTAGSGKTKKATATYECLLLPQSLSQGDFSVNITINGNKYTWISDADINLESNYKYELSIKVGKDYVTVGDVLVTDWEAGGSLSDGETDVVADADVWDGTIATAFAGGSGTKDDPYQIASGAQLAYLANGVNSGSGGVSFLGTKYFVLTKDIDLNNIEWTSIGVANYTWSDDAQAWLASGNGFYGLFDGQNHVISNLKMDRRSESKSVGLFGWIVPGSSEYSVKNLTIRNASVSGQHHVGILAGAINASSSAKPNLYNIHVSGKVEATEEYGWCGGMLGEVAWLTASGCTADVQVKGQGFTGGLVASAFSSSFNGCSAKGTVDGTWTVGGFAGTLFDSAKAKNCISYADVTSSDWRCGGFAGGLEGFGNDSRVELESCFAKGKVRSNQDYGNVGGFAGWCVYLTATDCAYTGVLTLGGSGSTGAFMGGDDGNCVIQSCWYDAKQNPDLEAVGAPRVSSSYDIKAVK